MTPPCANCHGSSNSWSTDFVSSGDSTTPACPSEARWPEWLARADPDLTQQDWWVRSNYEAARSHPFPLRIDVSRARLEAEIRLRPGQRSFAPFPWQGSPYRALGIEFSSNARLNSQIEIRDNAIPLGLRTLLSVEGVFVNGPAFLNLWPESLLVGNYGEAHLISRTSAGTLFLFDPFMVPRPPMGHDFPTEDQEETEGPCLESNPNFDGGIPPCVTGLVYPNHRDNPRIDNILTSLIPSAILDANGRLPQHFNLETLLTRILALRNSRPATSAAPDTRGPLTRIRAAMETLGDWVEPGSHLALDIEEIRDLLVPGLLDLGPSRGRFEVTYLGGNRVSAESPAFEINLDPMDLPARPGPSRSSIHLEALNLEAANAPAELEGLEIPPGIRMEFDAASGQLWLEANLVLQTEGTLPALGAIEWSGQLLFRSAILLEDDGLHPIPETTAIEFRGGQLWERGGRRPLLTDFTLALSDLPGSSTEPVSALSDFLGGPRLRGRLSGWLGQDRRLEVQAEIPLPLETSERYDFPQLLQNLAAHLEIQVLGDSSYAASVDLVTTANENAATSASHRGFQVNFDVRQGSHGTNPTRPLIQNGQIVLELDREGEVRDDVRLQLSAATFARGPITLRNLAGEMRLRRVQSQEGVTDLRISHLSLEANPHGSTAGILRGPLHLSLGHRADNELRISWNATERTLQVQDLDLEFSAAGLRILPPTLRRRLDPRVVALGIDGHFEGSFDFALPQDRRLWRGHGDLRLRGDRDGDIYFLDASGRRVGLPLIRDTRWRWNRVDRIDWRRRYALGRFHLDTLLNFSALLPAETGATNGAFAVGARGQRLLPYEVNGVMPYDNQPWDLTGFQNRIVDYLLALCRQEATCRSDAEGDER